MLLTERRTYPLKFDQFTKTKKNAYPYWGAISMTLTSELLRGAESLLK